MANLTGRQAKLYVNTAVPSAPTWLEVLRVGDLSMPLTKGQAELADRSSDYKKMLAGLKESGLEFTYHEDANAVDAVWDILYNSYLNDVAIEMAVMAGDITVTGVTGFRLPLQVFEMTWNQELESVLEYDFSLSISELLEGGTPVDPSRFVVP